MTITDYNIIYVDKQNNRRSTTVTSGDMRTAMNNLFELNPDACRVISCMRKPMFDQ